jgi:hypothetical protein
MRKAIGYSFPKGSKEDSHMQDGRSLKSAGPPLLLVALMMVFLAPGVASASWLSWISDAITCVGIGAACTPTGVGQVVGGVCGVVEVIGVGADVVKTATGHEPQFISNTYQPFIAAPPEPPAYLAGASALTNATYQPLPIPGNAADPLVIATNAAIADFNTLILHYRTGAPSSQIVNDLASLSGKLETVASQFDALTCTMSEDQATINSRLSNIGSSGLPAAEVTFLQNAGLTPTQIQGLAQYTANHPLNLAVGSVTASQLLHIIPTEVAPSNVPAASGRVVTSLGVLLLMAGATAVARRRASVVKV